MSIDIITKSIFDFFNKSELFSLDMQNITIVEKIMQIKDMQVTKKSKKESSKWENETAPIININIFMY